MSEIDVVLQTIKAAKFANEAAVKALEVVEKLLSPDDTCTHEQTVLVQTMSGIVNVCDCGLTFPSEASTPE